MAPLAILGGPAPRIDARVYMYKLSRHVKMFPFHFKEFPQQNWTCRGLDYMFSTLRASSTATDQVHRQSCRSPWRWQRVMSSTQWSLLVDSQMVLRRPLPTLSSPPPAGSQTHPSPSYLVTESQRVP